MNTTAPLSVRVACVVFAAGVAFSNCGSPTSPGETCAGYGDVSIYDFDMPIGTPFIAARGGVVAEVEQSHNDGQIAATGLDNYIVVTHDDGTADLYGHLTHNGAVATVGAVVKQGDLLGYSGNTGNTGNIPHLHFSVQSCDPVTGGSAGCPTVPVVFRNAVPNPGRLADRQRYTAS